MRLALTPRREVLSTLKAVARPVYHRVFRMHLRMRFWYADWVASPSEVPVPPAILRFRVSESLSVAEFLRVGAGWAGLIRRHVNGMGMDFASARRVLDFGCGCGRTMRWFLCDNGDTEFHGVDVDADAVDWCGRHLKRGHFLVTEPAPPLPYPAEYFDVVYCLSVFTHLNEPMQDAWLSELARILKPGGVLLLTVFGNAASNRLDQPGRMVLQEQGFVNRRSRKLRGVVPDWYQTTFHSRKYIVTRLSTWFTDIRYSEVPDGRQDVVTARRPSTTCSANCC